MTPTLDKMQIAYQEQMVALQSKLNNLNSVILDAEQFLSAKPDHNPTISRYNILCHNKSETLTKIRRLKEKMK